MSNQKTYTNQEIIEYFVCGECGGKLRLIGIEHEGEQAWCPKCERTHTGTTPEIFALAKEYCETFFFSYYTGYSKEHGDNLNRGKMCDIIRWVLRQR